MRGVVDATAGVSLLLTVAGLVATAALSARGDRFGRVSREGGSVFLGERLMHHGYRWIDALARTLVRFGVHANAISWFSLLAGIAAGTLVGFGWLGLSACALAISGLCDGLDGAVARLRGTVTVGGAVLDAALDRYVEFLFLAGLVVFFREHWAQQLLVFAALSGGFMVTYSTAKAEALRVTPPRGWMKRAERMVWLAGGAAFASAAPLIDIPAKPVMLSVLAIVALFSHASAILRLRALCGSADANKPHI